MQLYFKFNLPELYKSNPALTLGKNQKDEKWNIRGLQHSHAKLSNFISA